MSDLWTQHPHVIAVSPRLSLTIASRIRQEDALPIVSRSIDWLTTRHPGLSVYLGVVGREYTMEERVAIVSELSTLEHVACPYCRPEPLGCMLAGYLTYPEYGADSQLKQFGWLPTLLLRYFDRPLLRSLVASKQIADAKIASLTWRGAFPPPRYSTNQPWVIPSAQR